jgi:hypothetical protein
MDSIRPETLANKTVVKKKPGQAGRNRVWLFFDGFFISQKEKDVNKISINS